MAGTPIQPRNIHVGRGDIWLGVDVPDEGNKVPLDLSGRPSTGRNIGATVGPAIFRYNTTTVDIETQQTTMMVGFVTNTEDLRIEFEVGEITFLNLRSLLLAPKPQGDFIAMGGIIVPQVNSFMVVAPRRGGGFIEAMIYEAVAVESREFTFDRAGVMKVKTVVRGQAVVTRTPGDQGGFLTPYIPGSPNP